MRRRQTHGAHSVPPVSTATPPVMRAAITVTMVRAMVAMTKILMTLNLPLRVVGDDRRPFPTLLDVATLGVRRLRPANRPIETTHLGTYLQLVGHHRVCGSD